MKEETRRIGYGREYAYKGYFIYQVTRKDYCVYAESGCIIDALTLKEAKTEIDKLEK